MRQLIALLVVGCIGGAVSCTPRTSVEERRVTVVSPDGSAYAYGDGSTRARLDLDTEPSVAHKVGDQIEVMGTVTAASATVPGEIDEVVISSGNYYFSVLEPELRRELACELGNRVRLSGRVGAIAPGRITIQVDEIDIARD